MLKLPVVYQHYKEHQQADKNISIAQFLAMHYLHGSPRDNDYERDMQLPFKTSGDYITSIATAYFPSLLLVIAKPVIIREKKKIIPTEKFIISPFSSNIWQPPKSC